MWGQIKTRKLFLSSIPSPPVLYKQYSRDICYCLLLPPSRDSNKCSSTLILLLFLGHSAICCLEDWTTTANTNQQFSPDASIRSDNQLFGPDANIRSENQQFGPEMPVFDPITNSSVQTPIFDPTTKSSVYTPVFDPITSSSVDG